MSSLLNRGWGADDKPWGVKPRVLNARSHRAVVRIRGKKKKQSTASSREIRKKHRLQKSPCSKIFFKKTDVFKHSFLFKKLDRETITRLLLLSPSGAGEAKSRGRGHLC